VTLPPESLATARVPFARNGSGDYHRSAPGWAYEVPCVKPLPVVLRTHVKWLFSGNLLRRTLAQFVGHPNEGTKSSFG